MIDCSTPAALVEEYERFQPAGDPGAAPLLVEATAAVEAHIASTTARIIDDGLRPRSADTTALYAFVTSRPVAAASVTADRIEFHRRALETNPELAAMLREKECRDEIAQAAESVAAPSHNLEPIGVARARASRDALRAFLRGVAEQIAAVPGHPLAAAGRELLAAELLTDRLLAGKEMHKQAAAAVAARAAAERREAELTELAADDALEVERVLSEQLREHGLPADLRSGPYVTEQLRRLGLLVPVRRRLRTTSVNTIRVDRDFYAPGELSNAIADASIPEIEAITGSLDRAEAEAERTRPWTS